MLYVAFTFAVVFALVVGSYWWFVVRPLASSRKHLQKRIAKERVDRPRLAAAAPLVRASTPFSQLGPIQRLLMASGVHATEIQRLISWSGIRTTVGTVLLAGVFCGIATFSLVSQLTGSVGIAVVAAGLATLVPYMILRFLAQRQLSKFEEQFPEAVDLIARALKAGHAFTTGLSMAADELPDPTRREFRAVFDKQNYGMPIGEALKEFAGRVRVLDASFFVTAVMTQRESGGNLSEILERLASLIRDRFKVKRQIRTLSAHGRITGWVLGCLAPTLAGVLFLLAPGHMSKLIDDPLGQRMVMFALVMQVIGVLIMRRIIRPEF